MSQQSFADLGVSAAVCGALTQRGITEPFAIQRLVIADVLAGRDVLARSPTGSGKTLAFAVPIADRIEATDRRPAALVLAPTRELAAQIVEEGRHVAHARALKVAAVYGGVGIEKQAREAAKAHIVVATPGRLEDLIARGALTLRHVRILVLDEAPRRGDDDVRLGRLADLIARGALTLRHVRILVLDEADRMLDMGFRPPIDRIVAQTPADRQTLFFSATLEGEAGRVAATYTRDPVRHAHHPAGSATTAVEHRFVAIEDDDRIKALVRTLRGDRDRRLALVFVRTKHGADRLVKRLGREGVEALAMHGDKSQRQRERALASFEAGDVDTLVATDVAARGIDVDGITHVINFDPPADREGYVHRVGRTGRAGRTGVGITFVGREQARDVGKLAGELALHEEFATTGLSVGGGGTAGARGAAISRRSTHRR